MTVKQEREKKTFSKRIQSYGVLLPTMPMTSLDTPIGGKEFVPFFSHLKAFGVFTGGIGTLLVLTMLIRALTAISRSASREEKRREAFGHLLTCGAALALLGGIALPVRVFWNLFHP